MRVTLQTATNADPLSVTVEASERTKDPADLQVLIDTVYAAKLWLVAEITRAKAKHTQPAKEPKK